MNSSAYGLLYTVIPCFRIAVEALLGSDCSSPLDRSAAAPTALRKHTAFPRDSQGQPVPQGLIQHGDWTSTIIYRLYKCPSSKLPESIY